MPMYFNPYAVGSFSIVATVFAGNFLVAAGIKLFNSSSLPYAAYFICPLASKYVVDTGGTVVLFLTQ